MLEPRRIGPRIALRLAALAAAAILSCGCAPARQPAAKARVAASDARYFGDVTPPADDVLRFNLGAEPEIYDPGLAAGQSDGRVCRILFEGLTREDPRTLEPLPGQAYRWEETPDGLTYTFHLRPGIRWTDGSPVTAGDFRWSWLRVLEPQNGARYAGLLAPIRNAEAYNDGRIKDSSAVGIEARDDSTLVVTLGEPTAYFLSLTQFYTYLPVPRQAIARHGVRWTMPGNIVCNGAFTLRDWRQNDRFEFEKNPLYWDAPNVRLARIVAYTIDDLNTSTNLYKAGVIDWNPSGYVPSQFVPYLRGYRDFRHGSYQGVYYFSINVTRPPLDNLWVRRALDLAIDRDAIANDLLKGSRAPWGNLTPSGYPGYQHPPGIRYDPAKARECLARAGYPGGKGFRKISILFNTSEDHRRIAEAVQSMWMNVLHIEVELTNQEWGSFMQAVSGLQYDVARRSWIGDYLDPNSFLACWITGDGNNRSGWSSARYDRLIRQAARELDARRRFAILREAEALLLDQGPALPVYHYSTNELVKPYVRGIYQTPLDIHPLTRVWIDRDWQTRGAPDAPAAMADPDESPERAATPVEPPRGPSVPPRGASADRPR